ncbi:MAG: RtcB family protein [Thermodesulfobacteriota bacterium]|nr:RtcB family protein [Thermodesulfobacteriota bacterium]
MKKEKSNINIRPVPYEIWGSDIDPAAVAQMDDACSLPVAVRGALMPDAHKGYGLPIGGVLAVDNAVIPYAVGVDIACRMKMSILDIPYKEYEKSEENHERFKIALEVETLFGVGKQFLQPKMHRVMDEDWSFCSVTKGLKDKAWKQLGTSGSGNHFAEFGRLVLKKDELGLAKGEYLAFLTHSGSRGAGASVASHYSSIAKHLHPELSKGLNNLAWLDMQKSEGQEYWMAMELMGRYSSGNHEIIHQAVLQNIGAESLLTLENHHNFAWKEQFDGREVIVHRKGATPALRGVIGIIPGSMASPGFVVKGLGNEKALNSAAHGAGRRMSRNAAIKQFEWSDLNNLLIKNGVTLISAGLDEIPMAYKNIEQVMEQQKDLIEIIARFDPKLVKMAPSDSRSRSKRGGRGKNRGKKGRHRRKK